MRWCIAFVLGAALAACQQPAGNGGYNDNNNDGNNNGYDSPTGDTSPDTDGMATAECPIHVGDVADAQTKLDEDMRQLWSDHVYWTRLYIVAFANGGDDQQPTLDRLLKKQQQIGTAFGGYFGDLEGQHLTDLLTQHIQLAGQILVAAKAGDDASVATLKQQWFDNAHDLAVFLNGLAPEVWDTADVENMLDQHLNLTLDEATDRLTGNTAAEITAFDRVEDEALMMADQLTYGIVEHFPEKFQDCGQGSNERP